MTNSINTCAICLEDLIIPSNNMYKTNCSHIFHLDCINMSRKNNHKCPLCRANIYSDNQQMRNLHNRQVLITSFREKSILMLIFILLLLLLNELIEEKNNMNISSFMNTIKIPFEQHS